MMVVLKKVFKTWIAAVSCFLPGIEGVVLEAAVLLVKEVTTVTD